MYGDFRFKTYAPIAFRYFRELFNIKPADFLVRPSSSAIFSDEPYPFRSHSARKR